MSCIIRITNKKTGYTYAYESVSYRDPVTKKPKSKRTYLGRVDPVTNEILPKAEKGKRNRQKSTNNQLNEIGAKASAMEAQMEAQAKELRELKEAYNAMATHSKVGKALLNKLKEIVQEFDGQFQQE